MPRVAKQLPCKPVLLVSHLYVAASTTAAYLRVVTRRVGSEAEQPVCLDFQEEQGRMLYPPSKQVASLILGTITCGVSVVAMLGKGS